MSNTPQFKLVSEADKGTVLTLVVPGDPDSPYLARHDHPNFRAIVAAAIEGDFEDITALFDVADTIALKFRRLSERVTVEGESVYFDGVAVDSVLTQQIITVMNSGANDASWEALVNFFEKVQTNPSEASREALYVWIKAHQDRSGLTISEEGDIVGYKGVRHDPEYGYRSINSGVEDVRVNDTVYRGRIPNPLGATVEMPRDLVDPSSHAYCSVGLHVGTYGYASSFGGGLVLEVHVNPRDVVAVPADSGGQKVRTCRYVVVDEVSCAYTTPVLDQEVEDELTEGTQVMIWGNPLRTGVVLSAEDAESHGVAVEDGYIGVSEDSLGGHVGSFLPESLTPVDADDEDYDEEDEPDDGEFYVGQRVHVLAYEDRPRYDSDGTVTRVEDDLIFVKLDDGSAPLGDGVGAWREKYVTPLDDGVEDLDVAVSSNSENARRTYSGVHSKAAEGRGRNPYQDSLGRFSSGRPGSARDPKTGRFGG